MATPTAPARKRIVLIAHDERKPDLVEWAAEHREALARHDLYATGTTGSILRDRLDLPVTLFRSGPLGGDQQVGSAIAEGALDLVVFFWDPLSAQPHEPDVRALLRIAVVYDVPMACNRTSADFLLTSSMLDEAYPRHTLTFEAHAARLRERP
jgi:methylglyoxal synthase